MEAGPRRIGATTRPKESYSRPLTALETSYWTRRNWLKSLLGTSLGTSLAAWAGTTSAEAAASLEGLDQVSWLTGVSFSEDERQLMLEGMSQALAEFEEIRSVPLPNSVYPALQYRADPVDHAPDSEAPPAGDAPLPDPIESALGEDQDIAYAPVRQLFGWLRSRRISSLELTRFYLERMRRLDPRLACVINLTEPRALEEAARADAEFAAGRLGSPLQGVPWGAKDLLAVPGYPTTWGARPFVDQQFDYEATVVSRLGRAHAPLLAKLSVGALAWGDVWFGGTTKNPWKLSEGSSGSSAGSAAATAAGLVGFALGTETWGSIVSPCTRCGVTGLRPTFGAVSRYGAMSLSWTMDKIGPIARSVEDCAWVFQAIRGRDGKDPTVVERRFDWPCRRPLKSIRVGVVRSAFETDRTEGIEDAAAKQALQEWQDNDRRALKDLERAGIDLVPIELPDDLPILPLSLILTAEASAMFDDLTRSGRDDLLTRQEENAWPNVFRQGQLIPAVEYLRANRIRTLLRTRLEEIFRTVDVYVTPTYVGSNLLLTNLTGHPSVVVPNGFRKSDGTPTSFTFTGRPFGESETLSVAQVYQETTDHHRKHPPL